MNKQDFALLGKCFEADVRGGEFPVFQTGSKRMHVLQAQGLVEYVTITETRRPFPITVKGWKLTLKGHEEYCRAC